jgi:hypothetical protein
VIGSSRTGPKASYLSPGLGNVTAAAVGAINVSQCFIQTPGLRWGMKGGEVREVQTERPFLACLLEFSAGILRFWGEKFPLTGLYKTLIVSYFLISMWLTTPWLQFIG